MDLSIEPLQKSTTRLFGRFHFIIFFILIAAGLFIAIYLLNDAIASSDPANNPTAAVDTTVFDQVAIDRLNQLKEPGQTTNKIQVNGRINPF